MFGPGRKCLLLLKLKSCRVAAVKKERFVSKAFDRMVVLCLHDFTGEHREGAFESLNFLRGTVK